MLRFRSSHVSVEQKLDEIIGRLASLPNSSWKCVSSAGSKNEFSLCIGGFDTVKEGLAKATVTQCVISRLSPLLQLREQLKQMLEYQLLCPSPVWRHRYLAALSTCAKSPLSYGRVESVEDADGYVVASEYDNLNRLTQRTYPDNTTDTFTYNKLNLGEQTDRLGRITRHFYDGFGRRIATRDPGGRTIAQVWCDCGNLEALVDANGNRTTWERDVQGRITREIRADGTTDTTYTDDLSGRLKTVTDPMDQVTTITYNVDDSLASTGFINETLATPDISHTYDPHYPRPVTMVDGNGTTSYSYVSPGTNGAGELASVDGPFSSDTISYTYDELGRVLSRRLNGTGTEISYDELGRIQELEFPIGTFDYTYEGQTARRASVGYPNGQTTTYGYFDDEHDFQLQTIHHKNASGATLSKFDYTYDTVGNILTWRQERAGSAAKLYTFTHDLVDQLTSAVLTDTNTTPALLKRQAWSYDAAGNRTVDQTDDAVFATTHDAMNRMGTRAPGGPIVFTGYLDEAATVTIDGKPATVDASNNFTGTASLSGTTTIVSVKATDASGNETTKQYEVDANGVTTSYTYDANGNLTADGTKAYYWNALDQLVEVKEGSSTIATFEYDGDGRRTTKSAAGVTRTYIYDAEDIVEERVSGTSTDTIRYYHGPDIDEPLARKNSADVVRYYLADHLGSIVQESSTAGAITLDREYEPWGVPIQGASISGYAFTGREWDAEIASLFYRARYYQPLWGNFANDDPSGFADGPNLRTYVTSNPVRFRDPSGLEIFPKGVPIMKLPPSKAQALVTAAPLIYVAVLLTPTLPAVAAIAKAIRDNVRIDGPNAGFYQPNGGRMCQLMIRNQVVVRVDHQQRNPGGLRELHAHIWPSKTNPHGFEIPRRK